MKKRLGGLLAAAATAVTAALAAVVPAQAAGGAGTCAGGPVAPGAYSSLTITGNCVLAAGSVTVAGNVILRPGSSLLAAFGGSDLTAGGNLVVGSGAALVLGCEPEAFPCFNDPDQVVGTLSTNDRVGGNLDASQALALIVHHSTFGRNVNVDGGGGGVNCAGQPVLMGFPAYATFEDNHIAGNANIQGWQSCWLGFIRNQVGNNVNFDGNQTFLEDGNEVVTNTIARNLNCAGNSPAPHIGDSMGSLNTVGGRANGQCRSLAA